MRLLFPNLFKRLAATLPVLLAIGMLAPSTTAAEEGAEKMEPWTFVSFPDFFNFDVPNPWPEWETAVNWYLDQVEAENPDFVLVAGDMVNGHWWDGPRCVEQMGALYYSDWIHRMKDHGLKYYVAIGDHELGDDPWPPEKLELVPHFERVFAEKMQMPENGPANKKGLAYHVKHKNALIITVETFEESGGELHAEVVGEQLEWFKNVLKEHGPDAEFIIVQGHVPVFGPVASRSSSRIMHRGGRDSGFWKAMVEGGVDAYLCGEHHAVTVGEADGVWQIVHGSSWGRKVVNTQDYLVATVHPGRLELEMKSFPMHAGGEPMWNLHKSRGPREIVEISAEAMEKGPQVTGTLTIKATAGGNVSENATGVFAPDN